MPLGPSALLLAAVPDFARVKALGSDAPFVPLIRGLRPVGRRLGGRFTATAPGEWRKAASQPLGHFRQI